LWNCPASHGADDRILIFHQSVYQCLPSTIPLFFMAMAALHALLDGFFVGYTKPSLEDFTL
jgi:hypothetical protein